MTPAERARQLDKQEFEAECQAARRRALRHAEQCRQSEQQLSQRWLDAPTIEIIHNGLNTEQRARMRARANRRQVRP